MDVLKFLQEGNRVPNPDYNPKTKKGALQPPFLVNTDTEGSSTTGLTRQFTEGLSYRNAPINLHPKDYAPYDVYVNNFDDEKTLNLERAKNQSNVGQAIYALGRTLNTITVGTVVGAADVASVLVDALDEDGFNYERPEVVQALSDFKDAIDARMPLYRENPDKAFDVADMAWWAEMAPSIATSLTLMVPGVGVTKGLSAVGKLLNLSKNATKAANLINMGQKTRDVIATGGKLLTQGATMRLLENYQEAIGTKENAKEYALGELQNMTPEQRIEFNKNNPQYTEMDDNSIAEDIATNAADVTFNTDWWNIGFDVFQLYGLRKLASAPLAVGKSANLRNLNETVTRRFGMTAAEAADDAARVVTRLDKAKQIISNLGYDILHGVRNEWTEGVEEAVNYVASEKGMELARYVFDKDTPIKDFTDYLTDPHMWESAFWGVLGGVVFSAGAESIGGLYNRKFNKEFVSAEKQRENEINNRELVAQQYQQQIKKINEDNVNPFATDENGNNPVIANNSEKEFLLEVARKQYTSQLVMNAVDVGNVDFLEAYLNSDAVRKGYKERFGLTEQQAAQFQQDAIADVAAAKKDYVTMVNRAMKNEANFNIAQIIARQHLNRKNAEHYRKQMLTAYENLYNEEVANAGHITPEYEQAIEQDVYENQLLTLRNQLVNLRLSEDNSSNQELIADVQAKIKYLEDNPPIGFTEQTDDSVAKKAKEFRDLYSNEYDITYNLYNRRLSNAIEENTVKDDDKSLKKQIKHYNKFFDKARKDIVDGAFKDLERLYDKYGDNIFDSNNLSEEDARTYDKVKTVFTASDINNDEMYAYIDGLRRLKEIQDQHDAFKEPEQEPGGTNLSEAVNADAAQSSTGQVNGTASESSATPVSAPIDNAANPANQADNANPANQADTTEQPPVEDENMPQLAPVPVNSPAQPVYDDVAVHDFLLEWFGTNIENPETLTADDVQTAYSSFIAAAKSAGITKEDADIAWNNLVGAIYGDYVVRQQGILTSALDDNDKIMLRRALFALINRRRGNRSAVQTIIEQFVDKTNPNTKEKFGFDINDKTYFNIEDLVAHIYNIAGTDIVAEFLFDEVAKYLQSPINQKFVATDDPSVYRLSREQKANRIYKHAENRLALLSTSNQNTINVDETINNEERYTAVVNLNPGDKLVANISKDKSRLYFINPKTHGVVGYMGIPRYDDRTGTLSHVNYGWKYNVIINDDGSVDSDFKDYVFDIINNNPTLANELFLLNQRILELNYAGLNPVEDAEVQKEIARLYPLIENNNISVGVKTDDDIYNHVKHLTDIIGTAFAHPSEIKDSVEDWFLKIGSSYAQTYAYANGEVQGDFVVGKVNRGNILLTDEANQEILDAVNNYNEDKIKLATVTQTGLFQVNDEDGLRVANDKKKYIGTSFLFIPDGHGGYDMAQIAKPLFADISNDKINGIKAGMRGEIAAWIHGFLTNKITLDDVAKYAGELFGKNGLFNGVDFFHNTKQGFVSFYFYTEGRDDAGKRTTHKHYLFTLNEASGQYGRNVAFNTDTTNRGNRSVEAADTKQTYAYVSSFNQANTNQDLLEDIDIFINNAFISVPFKMAADKTKREIAGRYVGKKDGKVYINVGSYKTEYNSYQEFLVNNGLIRTKLTKDANGNNYSHNKYVAVNTIFNPAIVNNNAISSKKLTDKFDSAVFVDLLNKGNTIIDTYKTILDGNENALKILDAIDNLGFLPILAEVNNNLLDAQGNPAYAAYDYENNSIVFNSDEFAKHDYFWGLRRFVHESLHQNLNNKYTRTEALDKLRPIYEAYKKYVEENHPDDASYTKFLNIRADETINLEEFIVETLTNGELINHLNNISADGTPLNKTKNKSLLRQLLDIIIDVLGIEVNKNSLLERELELLNNINPKSDNITTTIDTAPQTYDIDLSEQSSNNPEFYGNDEFTNPDDSGYNDDNLLSAVSDNYTAQNISDFVNGMPTPLQPAMRSALLRGELYMTCR
jgi:hypothetical protein